MKRIFQKTWSGGRWVMTVSLLMASAGIVYSQVSETLATERAGVAEAQVLPMHRTRPSFYGTFRLGMTPSEVNATLYEPFGRVDWERLPIAKEYSTTDVRYIWKKLDQFTNLPAEEQYAECKHGSSYLVFLFDRGGLFRLSLRLMPDCASHQNVVETVAQELAVPLTSDDRARVFRSEVGNFVLAGVATDSGSTLEWARADAPKFDNQAW